MGLDAFAVHWAEQGRLPDALIRAGIRKIVRARRRSLDQADRQAAGTATRAFGQRLRAEPIAVLTEAANAQHYELPAEFFGLVLGAQRKYSCAWWPEGVQYAGPCRARRPRCHLRARTAG